MLRLRDAGIQISLDDFGTGYSSLTYLKKLPIQELKIDRGFIDGLGVDGDDYAITSAILAMSKQLGLRVVAEGVETDIQLQMLKQLSCDYVQGFYFSKPIDLVAFIDWYKVRKSTTIREDGQ
jgi:two-component system CheB/CheR fusion protein